MTRPACLTNKRLPKEAKDYEIRERERERVERRLSPGGCGEAVAHRCHDVRSSTPAHVSPRPRGD